MSKKSRITLKEYFKAGEMPTEGDFGDLIDSSLNKVDDQISVITKNDARYLGVGTPTPNAPLSIRTSGNQRKAISLEDPDGSPSWHIHLNSSGERGLALGESDDQERVFIQVGGQVGIGTIEPQEKLDVEGKIRLREGLEIRSDQQTVSLTQVQSEDGQPVLDVSSIVRAPALAGDGSALTNITTGVPMGTIVMFNGTEIPHGWALCDGKNGTPDLQDRFIVGSGKSYSLGDEGGANAVKLSKAQMPRHSHSVSGGRHKHKYRVHRMNDFNWNHSHGYDPNFVEGGRGPRSAGTDDTTRGHTWNNFTYRDGDHSHAVSNSGSSHAHENRPPYYAVTFIIRVA